MEEDWYLYPDDKNIQSLLSLLYLACLFLDCFMELCKYGTFFHKGYQGNQHITSFSPETNWTQYILSYSNIIPVHIIFHSALLWSLFISLYFILLYYDPCSYHYTLSCSNMIPVNIIIFYPALIWSLFISLYFILC